MSQHNFNRRQFIRGASAAFALASLQANGMDFLVSPSAKPRRVALIGTGWYGKSDLFRLIQVAPVEVVGLCDPDKHLLEKAVEMVSQRQSSHKKPALYGDYRKLIAEQKPEIVLIGSPDHWHALQAIESIQSGAHVYVQKPISVDVMEGEA